MIRKCDFRNSEYEFIPEDIDELEKQISKVKQALYANKALLVR